MPSQARKVLPAHEPRFGPVAHLAQFVSDQMRVHGLHSVIGMLKRSRMVENLLFKPAQNTVFVPDTEQRAALAAMFRTEVLRFEQALGRPLPTEWRDIYQI